MKKSPKKNIVYVTPYYPPYGAGGAERTCAMHADILTHCGYAVTVITLNYGDEPTHEKVGAINVIRVPAPRLDGIGTQIGAGLFKRPSFWWYLYRQIIKELKGQDIACIHAQNAQVYMSSYLVSRWLNIPLVAHIRDTASICSLGGICLMERGTSQPPATCSVFKHVSCYIKRVIPFYEMQMTWQEKVKNISQVLYHYFDFVCRRWVVKRAARLVVAGNVYGDTWHYDRDHTLFLGFKDTETIQTLYSYCDCVVLPSTWPEPLGWPTLDAGRFAKPIVATRVGGVDEAVIHNETGILVEKLDPESMCAALEKILMDPAAGREMGQHAHAYVMNKFGSESMRSRMEQVYAGI